MFFTKEFDTFAKKVENALQAFNNRDFDTSYNLCSQFLNEFPDAPIRHISNAFHMMGVIELTRGFLQPGKEKLEKAAILHPPNAQVHAHLGIYYAEMEANIEKATEILKKAQDLNANDSSVQKLAELLNRMENDRINSVMVNTMPKTGTMSIWGALHAGLGVQRIHLSNQVNSLKHEVIDPEKVKRFVRGSCAAQGHFPGTNLNIYLMATNGMDRMMVHVRDPRQAMLSWIHFIDKMIASNGMHLVDYPLCDNYFTLSHDEQLKCPDYCSKDLEEKIDIHIEHYLPLLVDWISSWIEQQNNHKHGIKIEFTRFEDFKFEPELFFKKVLSFWEIDHNLFKMPDFKKQGKSHFRKGLVDEFREVFSKSQLEKANRRIPNYIFQKFDWKK